MPEAELGQVMIEQAGFTEDNVDVAVMVHFHALRMGWADLVTDAYVELTGQPPTSVEDWVRAKVPAFATGVDGSVQRPD